MATRREKYLPLIMVAPAFIFLAALTIFPFGFSINMMLRKWHLMKPARDFVGLVNFLSRYNAEFFNSLKLSLTYVAVAVPLELMLGTAIALLIMTYFERTRLIKTLIVVPMVMTPIVAGITWKWMYDTQFGVLSYFVQVLGFGEINFLGEPSLALLSIIAVDIWQWTPLVVLVMMAALAALPREPLESAAIDGASPWQSFVHITLPLVKSTILVVLLLRSIDVLKVFDLVYAMTEGGPYSHTNIVGYMIYKTALKSHRFDVGTALAFLTLLITLGISTFLIRVLYREE